jgi:hypothetical protein
MPHIPRRFAHTTGTPPEFHAPQRAATPSQPETQDDHTKLGGDKLNIRTWEKKPNEIARVLFGKEPDIDPVTHQMVFTRPTDIPAYPQTHAPGAGNQHTPPTFFGESNSH